MSTGKHAVLSYTDLAAAGSRTCLGIEGDVDVQRFNLAEILEDQPAAVVGCADDNDVSYPVQIRKNQKVTCYVINCHIPSRVCHQVANKLLDHVINSGMQQLTVLTALRSDPRHGVAMPTLMESCFNCKPATGFPSVPDDFQVEDAFLNALRTLLRVEDIPTRFLVARGYRASKGCPSESDGSLQAIESLQKALSKLTTLQFCKEKTAKLDYVSPDGSDRDVKTMLYM